MKQYLAATLAALLIIVGVGYLLTSRPHQLALVCTMEAKLCPNGTTVGRTGPNCEFAPCTGVVADYKNATYTIDGQQVTLVQGRASMPAAPGSASSIVTTYFGNEATADLNNDKKPDTVFLITQNTGGSGTYFYAVAALTSPTGYQGTNAILLGDRIAPQTTEIKNGEIIVNYADRKPSDPMTTAPSVGVSKYIKVVGTTLTVVKK